MHYITNRVAKVDKLALGLVDKVTFLFTPRARLNSRGVRARVQATLGRRPAPK